MLLDFRETCVFSYQVLDTPSTEVVHTERSEPLWCPIGDKLAFLQDKEEIANCIDYSVTDHPL